MRASERPGRLELLVRARPFTQAVVTLQLHDDAGGTRIEMDEHPADRRSRLFFNPLTEPLIRLRNAESLRRLKVLAEGSEPIPTGALPARESPEEAAVEGQLAAGREVALRRCRVPAPAAARARRGRRSAARPRNSGQRLAAGGLDDLAADVAGTVAREEHVDRRESSCGLPWTTQRRVGAELRVLLGRGVDDHQRRPDRAGRDGVDRMPSSATSCEQPLVKVLIALLVAA